MGEGKDGRREERKGESEGERKGNNTPYKILLPFIVERHKRLQRENYGTTDTGKQTTAQNSTEAIIIDSTFETVKYISISK